MKKTFITLLCAAMTMGASADTYFFVPGDGLGDQDGTSWENAAAGEYLGDFLSSAEPGTVLCLQEGSYKPSTTTNLWTIGPGVTLIGGYPTTMTGTDTEYDLSLGGQSIFSADLDGDGKGDNLSDAFVYIGPGSPKDKAEEYFSSWGEPTIVKGITFRDGYRKESKYWGNMVFVQSAVAEFHYCQFLNNNSWRGARDANGSNGAIEMWGSLVHITDCIFRDNITAAGSGAAFQIRARQSDSGASDVKESSVVIVERCEITNNIAYCTGTSTEGDASWGTYGGAFSVADNGGFLLMANNTISESRAWYRGSACRLGGGKDGKPNCIYLISNTFFNNECQNGAAGNGSALSSGDNSKSFFMNNIMVEDKDYDVFDGPHAPVYLQSGTAFGYSGGYNVFGTVYDNGDKSDFVATDNRPKSFETLNTTETVFGSNKLTDKGGVSKIIEPTMTVTGIAVADMTAKMDAWIAEGPQLLKDAYAKYPLDLTKDQRGYTRAATTMSGAYDKDATVPVSALPMINSKAVRCTKAVENGQFFIEKNGVRYNMLGAQL